MNQSPCPQNHPAGASAATDFGHVVKHHAAMVHATARRITQNSALAEDVAQETFLALARQPHGALASVQAWLRRVAGRKAMNAVRSESRRRRVEEAATLASSSPEERSQWNDVEPIIRQTLEELPPDLKESLVEHYLEGRSQLDIAARRSTSQSTISRQIAAGMRELRRRLRAKGILCGAGLTALWSGQPATAASTSSAGLLGQLGASTAPTSTSASTVTSTLIAMNAAKAALAVAAASALIAIPVLLRDRQDTPDKPAVSKSSPKSPSTARLAPASSTKTRKPNQDASAEKRYRPDPVPESVRLKVDALVQRSKGWSKNEPYHEPEYQQLLQKFAQMLIGPDGNIDPEGRLMRSMTSLLAIKGTNPQILDAKDGVPGDGEAPEPPPEPFIQMLMDPGPLDEPRGRAWAEAVLSEDPKRAEDWVVNVMHDAAFEFAFDPTKESSGGVSFKTWPDGPREDKE